MLGGYAGKILFVDLDKGSIREEVLPEKICREFIGGYGLGIRILYEQMKPRVDPFSRDNMLGFVTGALTATTVPGSGRYGSAPAPPFWSRMTLFTLLRMSSIVSR